MSDSTTCWTPTMRTHRNSLLLPHSETHNIGFSWALDTKRYHTAHSHPESATAHDYVNTANTGFFCDWMLTIIVIQTNPLTRTNVLWSNTCYESDLCLRVGSTRSQWLPIWRVWGWWICGVRSFIVWITIGWRWGGRRTMWGRDRGRFCILLTICSSLWRAGWW